MKLVRLVAALSILTNLICVTELPAVPTPTLYKVGIAGRTFHPKEPYNWRGAQTHALITQVWYPADAASVEEPQWVGSPENPLFSAGRAAQGTGLASSPWKYPLIVLSHGTGGSAMIMAWFAAGLASHGYIVAVVNHPGNNGTEAYTPQGFMLWWERARDLGVVIDNMLSDPAFGIRIDPKRIGAAGFSLGGYTMMELAGATTDRQAFLDFCKSPKADAICQPPPEFTADLFQISDQLQKADPEVRESLARSGNSYRDTRVRSVFAMAPAIGQAFTVKSLEQIEIPVAIVGSKADQNVPFNSNGVYIASHIRNAKLTVFTDGEGHYDFLDSCTELGRKSRPDLCAEAPKVDRDKVHQQTIELAAKFFNETLK